MVTATQGMPVDDGFLDFLLSPEAEFAQIDGPLGDDLLIGNDFFPVTDGYQGPATSIPPYQDMLAQDMPNALAQDAAIGPGHPEAFGAGQLAANFMSSGDSANGSGTLRQHPSGTSDTASAANGHLIKAEAQLQKLRETSRKAQKKYREKQRSKLLEAEARVTELTAQLNQMRVDQETLTARSQLLERCMAMQRQQTASGALTIVELESEAWWLDEQMKELLDQSPQLRGEFTFTVGPKAPLRLTRDQTSALSPAELGGLKRAYLEAYAACLLQLKDNPSSPAAQRLERLWHESGQLFASIMICSPDRVHNVLNQITPGEGSDEDPARESAADQEDRRLLHEAHFSQEQKDVLQQMWTRLHINLGKLQRRRDLLTAELQDAMPQQHNAGVVNKKTGNPTTGNRFCRTLAAMEALRNTLRDEHSAFLQCTCCIWRLVFGPRQGAHLMLQAFPGEVRIYGIAEKIAIAAGSPSAKQLLAQGAADPDSPLLPMDEVLPPHMRVERNPPVTAGMSPQQVAALGLG